MSFRVCSSRCHTAINHCQATETVIFRDEVSVKPRGDIDALTIEHHVSDADNLYAVLCTVNGILSPRKKKKPTTAL